MLILIIALIVVAVAIYYFKKEKQNTPTPPLPSPTDGCTKYRLGPNTWTATYEYIDCSGTPLKTTIPMGENRVVSIKNGATITGGPFTEVKE